MRLILALPLSISILYASLPISASWPQKVADQIGDVVTFTTATGLRGQANHGERIAEPARLGVLLATLILASVSINGQIILADSCLR